MGWAEDRDDEFDSERLPTEWRLPALALQLPRVVVSSQVWVPKVLLWKLNGNLAEQNPYQWGNGWKLAVEWGCYRKQWSWFFFSYCAVAARTTSWMTGCGWERKMYSIISAGSAWMSSICTEVSFWTVGPQNFTTSELHFHRCVRI